MVNLNRLELDQIGRLIEVQLYFSSIYGGEDYDARLYQTGWDKVGFIDSGNNWRSAPLVSAPKGTLCSRMIPRNKVQETI